MKLLLVSNFTDIPDEHLVLNLLFCEGLRYFHLRKADYTHRQMATYIERIAEPFRQYVVLHSHFDLIDEYGLRGAHFTKRDTYEGFLKSKGKTYSFGDPPYFDHLSFSLHAIAEIKRMPAMYAYIFLSPIFDSISNQGYNSKFHIHDLKLFLSRKDNRPEIMALGGVNDAVVDKVFETGFDGMALLGYIWTAYERDRDIVSAVKRFRLMKQLIRLREDALPAPEPALTKR